MLSPGEMSVGQIVTVFENKPYENEETSLFGDTVQKTKRQDRSGYGSVLRIQAIDLPYVVCLYLDDNIYGQEFKVTFDTRRTSFKELNLEFAKEKALPKYQEYLKKTEIV